MSWTISGGSAVSWLLLKGSLFNWVSWTISGGSSVSWLWERSSLWSWVSWPISGGSSLRLLWESAYIGGAGFLTGDHAIGGKDRMMTVLVREYGAGLGLRRAGMNAGQNRQQFSSPETPII